MKRTHVMDNSATGGNAAHSLSTSAYRHILDRLLSNELVPGENLNRRDVARDLGMSVAPVLEAMLQLEMEGFLVTIPRKGTQVRPIRTEDVLGSLIVREALECQAARLYCGCPVEQNMDRLSVLADTIDTSDSSDPNHWKHEIEFHGQLVALAECPMLLEEFKRSIHLSTFHGLHRLSPDAGRDQENHRELLKQLCVSDPDEAERVIRRHSRSGKGILVAGLN